MAEAPARTFGKRWLLKTPHHLLRMDILLRIFPGVQVILTHRDPVQSIPSIASFVDTLWRIYSNDVVASIAGRSWSDRMARGLSYTMNIRQMHANQFLDVSFEDTVKNPLGVVQRIYEFIGWDQINVWTSAMKAWLAVDNRSHSAAHEYTPEQYGLTTAQIRNDFAEYIEQHIKPAKA